MRRLVASMLLGLALLAPAVAAGQSSMPFGEYRAGVQGYEDMVAAREDPPITMDTLMDRYDTYLGIYEAELARLSAITPEDCYSAAHAELVASWTTYIANWRDARPSFESAESVMGILPIGVMIEGIVADAHPSAYVDDPTSMTGKRLDRPHLIDALQTCVDLPSPGPSSLPAAPSRSPGSPARVTITMTDGEIVWPDVTLPPGDYRADWMNTCRIGLSFQGASVVLYDDPSIGSRMFTIEPNHSGTSIVSSCEPSDRVLVEIR